MSAAVSPSLPKRPYPNWLVFMAAGVIAAGLCYFAARLVIGTLQVPLPAEIAELQANPFDDAAQQEALRLTAINHLSNARRALMGVGWCLGMVFGVAEGIRLRRWGRALAAGVLGGAAGAAVGAFAAPVALALESYALRNEVDRMREGLYVHVAIWTILSLALLASMYVGSGSLTRAFRTGLLGILAAAIGGLAYVLIAATVHPERAVENTIQQSGSTLLMWAAIPPLVIGLFLARAAAPAAQEEHAVTPADPPAASA